MKYLLLLLVLGLLAPGRLPAQGMGDVELGVVVRTLETPFQAKGPSSSGITDFKGDFSQESHIASLDRTQRGRGEVMVEFDGSRSESSPRAKFRWEYREPSTQLIVSDGRTVWVYLPDNRQVIRTVLDPNVTDRPDDPVTFLTGLGNLSRDFHIAWASPPRDGQENFVLELRPRKASPMIERMLAVVDREAVPAMAGKGTTGKIFPLRAITVFDPNGNSTRIEFSNIRVNGGLLDSLFDFTPPDGVEVVSPPTIPQ